MLELLKFCGILILGLVAFFGVFGLMVFLFTIRRLRKIEKFGRFCEITNCEYYHVPRKTYYWREKIRTEWGNFIYNRKIITQFGKELIICDKCHSIISQYLGGNL